MNNTIIIRSLITFAVACIAIWLKFKTIQNQNVRDIFFLNQCILKIEEQKNEEISDLKKQVLDLENFLTCLIMVIYMMNEADRQSFQNHMENRSLMEELVEMKMEYDQAKK